MEQSKSLRFSQQCASQTINQILFDVKMNHINKILSAEAQKIIAHEVKLGQENSCLQLCPNVKNHDFQQIPQDLGKVLLRLSSQFKVLKERIRPLSATCSKIRVYSKKEKVRQPKTTKVKKKRYDSARFRNSKDTDTENLSLASKKKGNYSSGYAFRQKKIPDHFLKIGNDQEDKQPQIIDILR